MLRCLRRGRRVAFLDGIGRDGLAGQAVDKGDGVFGCAHSFDVDFYIRWSNKCIIVRKALRCRKL